MANESTNGTLRRSQIIAVGDEPPPMEPSLPAPSSRSDQGMAKQPPTAKHNSGERFAVLNQFVDFTLATLSRAELAVWLVLYRDTRDGTATTSYDDLARRVGCNRRNVGRALKRLIALGLVRVEHQGGLGRGASRYRVQGKDLED
jgi:predicted transcriptional regulator